MSYALEEDCQYECLKVLFTNDIICKYFQIYLYFMHVYTYVMAFSVT